MHRILLITVAMLLGTVSLGCRQQAKVTLLSDVKYSRDGSFLVLTGSEGGMLKGVILIVDSLTLTESKRISTGPVASMIAVSPDGKLVAGDSNTTSKGGFRIWNIETGVLVAQDFADVVWGLDFAPNGRTLAISVLGDDGGTRFWDIRTRKRRIVFRGGKRGTTGVRFSPDGQLVASSTHSGVGVWNLNGNKKLFLKTKFPNAIAFSPDAKLLAIGGYDGTLVIWSMSSRKHVATLKGHKKRIQWLEYSPNGKMLASCSADRTLRIWHTEKKTLAHIVRDRAGDRCAFSRDGKSLAFVHDASASVLDLASWARKKLTLKGE